MKKSRRAAIAACLSLLIWSAVAVAQEKGQRLPEPLVPRGSLTAQEKNRRQALELYGLGLWCIENNRLLDAAEHLEKAGKLDPNAVAIIKALIPVYLALDRTQDALEACHNYLKLDADDYQTWCLYAGQLKAQGKPEEATEAMAQAAACSSLQDHPYTHAQICLDLGILQQSSKNCSAAETAFRQALQILTQQRKKVLQDGQINEQQLDAEIAKAWERIGSVCKEAKRYSQAAEALAQAQNIIRNRLTDPDRALLLSRSLAEIHGELREWEKARTELEEFLQSQPPGSDAYEMEIQILTKLGDQSEILPTLERSAERDRHNVSLHLLLARRYAEEKQWERAKTKYRDLAKEDPTPEIYRGLFALLHELGEIDKILIDLDCSLAKAKGQNKEPGDPAAASQARAMLVAIDEDGELVNQLIQRAKSRLEDRQPLDFATWHLLAVFAARGGQLKSAEAFFRACLDASTSGDDDLYVGLVQVLRLEHKNADIVEVCRKGLKESQPAHLGFFYQNLALALAQLGKIDEALEEAGKTIALAGESDRLHSKLLRVQVLYLGDRHEQAIKECTALLKEAASAEDRRDVRYLLSGVFTSAHDLVQAEEQLRVIIHDFPDDAGAHNDLGYILADQGKNLAEAEELIRKAIALDREQKQKQAKSASAHDQDNAAKDNAAFVDSLGWVYFRQGKLQEAKRELEKALSLSEQGEQGADDPVIWDHLGDVYFRLDDKAKARTLWEKAVTLYEVEKRRKLDDQYKALKHKLELLESP